MCGICVSVLLSPNISEPLSHDIGKDLKLLLQKRGPDFFEEVISTYDGIKLHFCSSVLHLRGLSLIKQPVKSQNGDIFLWNGEIFSRTMMKSDIESDTEALAEALFKTKGALDVLQIFTSIEGPYAFIFYQANGLLWFGRDVFGRRSLLYSFENSSFSLCSIAHGNAKWNEVPTIGIFCLDLNQSKIENKCIIHLHSWSHSASGNQLKNIPFLNNFEKEEVFIKINTSIEIPLSKPLNRTVCLDSEYLHIMTDLYNHKTNAKDVLLGILKTSFVNDALSDFENVLSDALKKRVQNHIELCKECYLKKFPKDLNCDHASVGILFSGGLDSIVIACLADRHLPKEKPIDLLNVAFSSLSSKNDNSKINSSSFDTPDRITGRNGLKELMHFNPLRKWNFVEVNISKEELGVKRKEHIKNLLIPSCTVLDDSIGCALWFASHGKGHINAANEYCSYSSPVRVLLVGMGADEQLAGYSRHRAKFNTEGWEGLIEELSLELDRIGSRNLGRDDRIIADNGVESRYPFLDENVVSFLNFLPVWIKANLNFPRGIGEKLLLRLLAYKLGLTEASVLPKRAIQFGSRIAKIENTKEKGSDVCDRLSALKC